MSILGLEGDPRKKDTVNQSMRLNTPSDFIDEDEDDALFTAMDNEVNNIDADEDDALFTAMDNEVNDDETLDTVGVEPLFSFGDQELFKQQLEEKGLEGVTREMVEIAQRQLPQFSFTYEQFKDGSADVLDYIGLETELPTVTRAMSDEAILALLTDVEDYGKYNPPTQKKNSDGTPVLNESGEPVYETENYNLRAIGGGVRDSAIDAGLTTLGGWQGARLGATAYASRFPRTGNRILDTVGTLGATGVGAVVGSGILTAASSVVNEWLFDEPDPIVVPSLQAAYNSGQTAAYGISFLATPLVGTKLAGKDLSEVFNAGKTLQQFKSIASSKYNPDEMTAVYGKIIAEKAAKAKKLQEGKGTVRKMFTPDQSKGPTAMRITDTLTRGGAEAMRVARENPLTFLGTEAMLVGGTAVAAYNAEKFFPGSEGARFVMEIGSTPPSYYAIKAVTGTFKGTYNVLKGALSGELFDKAKGVRAEKSRLDAGRRLTDEIKDSPEYKTLGTTGEGSDSRFDFDNPDLDFDAGLDSEQAYAEAIDALTLFGQGRTSSEVLRDFDSPLTGAFERIEGQLSTRSQELSVATEAGREQFIADSKEAIFKLRETNTAEGIQLAASIEQRLVEQEIIDEFEIANDRLMNATKTLFGNDSDVPADEVLGKRFYDLQLRLVAGLKAKRDRLYNAVPDFEVRSFTNREGDKVKQPNSLTIFSVPANRIDGGLLFNSLGGETQFNTIIGPYKDDFNLMNDYFNPTGRTDEAGNFVAGALDNVPDYPVTFSRLREMLSYFKSTRAARLKVDPSDPMATHLQSLIKALNQDMTGMDANQIFLTPEGTLIKRDESEIVNALMKANAFTAGMHNVISRTFISEFSRVNASRGMVLDPLEAVKAVKDGDDITLKRIQQMQDAAIFLRKEASDVDQISYIDKSTGDSVTDLPFDAGETALELNEIIELIVRDARKNIVKSKEDPLTGKTTRVVDLELLRKYKERPNTATLFSIFPTLGRNLETVKEAQILMNQTKANAKALKNTVEQKAFKLFFV